MVDQAVVSVTREYLRALRKQGMTIRFGVLFGSWARGKAHRWSDIDLLVVSPKFDGSFDREDVKLLWRQAARVDSRIEPVACGEKQWQEDDSSVVIEMARREGKKVLVEEGAA